MRLQPPRSWRRAFDPLAAHSVLATTCGLALVALLVPILSFWHGSSGPLGQSIPLFFLVPVLLASAMGGRGAGVVVSVIAIFMWDWFFIPPLYRATVASARDLLALLVFLAVALLTGQLATVARRRTREALRRAWSSEALYDLSMALIARRNLSEVLAALTTRLRETFDLEACAVVLPAERDAAWRTAAVAGDLPQELRAETSRNAAAVASWVNRKGEVCGLRQSKGETQDPARRNSDAPAIGSQVAPVQFLPLRVGARSIGVLELVFKTGETPDSEREQLLTTLANGVAIALEQERLFVEEREAELARESDRLKSALLSSVSHDLRTPLAGIKAASSSLLQEDIRWRDEDRRAFLLDIDSEADRLTRLVSNLLDLSRIEAGVIKPIKEWEGVDELVNRVLRRLEPRLTGHPVIQNVPDDLPPVRLDAVQIEQVLTNLIENAAKYSPPGLAITVSARVGAPAELLIEVSDRGPGIPEGEQRKIFDKFYRIAGSGRRTDGMGMGLAIVKGLVEAHGGHIEVESALGDGTRFTVVLPVDTAREGQGSGAVSHETVPRVR